MTSSVKWLAGLFLFLLTAPAPLAAASQDSPRFLIGTIVVQGVTQAAGRQIVAEESLLKPGQTYTEQELRQAVYRVRRLPFVVTAEYSLREGSAGGSYELVLDIEEEAPVSLSADASVYRAQQVDFNTWRNKATTTWQRDATLGGRAFAGSQGLVYGSVEKAEHQDGVFVQGGYTRYGLLGAGSFAGGEIDSVQGDHGKNDQDRIFLSGGIPLSAAQSLRAALGWQRSKYSPFFEGTYADIARFVNVDWGYDTTDDPLFPRSGSSASFSVAYQRDASHQHESVPGFEFDARITVDSFDVGVGGRHYWPLTARQSLELEAFYNRQSTIYTRGFGAGYDSWQGTLVVGHSMRLMGFEPGRRFGDLHFENVIVARYYDDNGPFSVRPSESADFVSSLAYRTRWGVLRLTFTYVSLWTNQ
jgi:outer membrane protein assembly factor BamA